MGEVSTEFKKTALRQKQSLPLEGKIILSQQRIKEWYDHWGGNVYISFSGGKDSTVLLDLVKGMYPDVPAVFCDTGLEYPEVRTFATALADVIIRPKMRFDKVIQTYGYPVVSKEVSQVVHEARVSLRRGRTDSAQLRKLRGQKLDKDGNKSSYNLERYAYLLEAPFAISHRCCQVMKKDPFKAYEKENGRKAIIGTIAAESALRTTNYLRYGCNVFDRNRPTSQPLSVWLEQDILSYIKTKELPIASVYGEITGYGVLSTTGASRTGCMFCMFGAQCDKAPNRFQRMQKTHPRQYAYCMKPVEDGGLGLQKVLEYLNIPYESDGDV